MELVVNFSFYFLCNLSFDEQTIIILYVRKLMESFKTWYLQAFTRHPIIYSLSHAMFFGKPCA